jgi:thiamine phosphate synthase YjbQ (UPF0047 family)
LASKTGNLCRASLTISVWKKLAPENSDSQYAHLKRTIMGGEVVVAINRGELDLGPWKQTFYGEFHGASVRS